MMKHLTHHLLIRSLLCLAAFMPLVSNALDLTFVPRVQAGVMSYEFEKKPVVFFPGEKISIKSNGYKLSSPMPFVSGGVTAFLNSFFIDVYLQKAFSGSDRAAYTWEYANGDQPNERQIDSKFDRNEYSLSVGYAIGEQWAVFGGYRKARTSFATLGTGEKRNLDKDGALQYTFTSRSLADTDFKQDGYFLGATYVFSVSKKSVISLNAAIAALDGKFITSFAENRSTVYPDGHEGGVNSSNGNARFDGDSVGLNLGIKWKGRIDSNFGYNLGLNGYSYDFEGDEDATKRTYSEAVLRLSAGLSYEF